MRTTLVRALAAAAMAPVAGLAAGGAKDITLKVKHDGRYGGTLGGQHVDDFGAKWHLVAPDGSVIEDGK